MICNNKQNKNHFGNNHFSFVFLLFCYLVNLVATKLDLQAEAEPKLHQPYNWVPLFSFCFFVVWQRWTKELNLSPQTAITEQLKLLWRRSGVVLLTRLWWLSCPHRRYVTPSGAVKMTRCLNAQVNFSTNMSATSLNQKPLFILKMAIYKTKHKQPGRKKEMDGGGETPQPPAELTHTFLSHLWTIPPDTHTSTHINSHAGTRLPPNLTVDCGSNIHEYETYQEKRCSSETCLMWKQGRKKYFNDGRTVETEESNNSSERVWGGRGGGGGGGRGSISKTAFKKSILADPTGFLWSLPQIQTIC